SQVAGYPGTGGRMLSEWMAGSSGIRTEQGVIEYYPNENIKRQWQNQAYRRVSFSETYAKADWCMALDGDEFLNVHVGNGTVQDLIVASGDADEILVNWRMYGANGHRKLSEALVVERFTATEPNTYIQENVRGFKSLFRSTLFQRPGIHRAKVPVKEDFIVKNGSGLRESEFEILKWRSKDPLQRKFAQVNHYAIRDAESFLMKSHRGSASHPDRVLETRYWRKFDANDEQDASLANKSLEIWQKMRELDQLSKGRLLLQREKSIAIWRETLAGILATEHGRRLYDDLVSGV
ncbi:hypothetical protein ACEN2R_19725, partial [Pseudogemmobacter sp. W21_MBD1_M6]